MPGIGTVINVAVISAGEIPIDEIDKNGYTLLHTL